MNDVPSWNEIEAKLKASTQTLRNQKIIDAWPRRRRRLLVVTAALPVLAMIVGERFWRGVCDICFYIRCDVRENFDQMKREWKK